MKTRNHTSSGRRFAISVAAIAAGTLLSYSVTFAQPGGGGCQRGGGGGGNPYSPMGNQTGFNPSGFNRMQNNLQGPMAQNQQPPTREELRQRYQDKMARIQSKKSALKAANASRRKSTSTKPSSSPTA